MRQVLVKLGAGVVLLAALGLAVWWDEVPAWRWGGTASVHAQSVAFDPGGDLCPQDGQLVELRGDSIVVGGRMGEGETYGRVMAQTLARGVRVELNGRGGVTALDGEASLNRKGAKGDVVLLAYGTNDSALRGWVGGKTAVPLDAFRESLTRQVAMARRTGARVALIAPPPAGSPAMMARLQPYRTAVSQVGRAHSVRVFDPVDGFADCAADQPLLGVDALHPNGRGHACIGQWLARQMCRL